mmetsp:Transcript_8370/g.8216  ORF Transcript_8370/g.8216 Transcript_8370/m.8216 type:complete len:84 (+) Transcript_8370:158-409(+)
MNKEKDEMEQEVDLIPESSTTSSDSASMETSSSLDGKGENNNNSDEDNSDDDTYTVGDKSQGKKYIGKLNFTELIRWVRGWKR